MKGSWSGLKLLARGTKSKVKYDENIPIDEVRIVCRPEDYTHIKRIVKAEGFFGTIRALPSMAVMLWRNSFRRK